MNKNALVIVVVVLLILLIGAWMIPDRADDININQNPATSTTGGNNSATSTNPVTSTNQTAANAARNDLAAKLSIAPGTIAFTSITAVTWNDGCLGLGGPAESCIQSVIPGYRVEMRSNGMTYAYRTDGTGAVVRAETEIR
jgi:hypothetical protein